MCDECGVNFLVYPSGPPFTVVKLQDAAIVILDSFATEAGAVAFASALHAESLRDFVKSAQSIA
jgi:hypothetical protein